MRCGVVYGAVEARNGTCRADLVMVIDWKLLHRHCQAGVQASRQTDCRLRWTYVSHGMTLGVTDSSHAAVRPAMQWTDIHETLGAVTALPFRATATNQLWQPSMGHVTSLRGPVWPRLMSMSTAFPSVTDCHAFCCNLHVERLGYKKLSCHR